jgi:S1-C subfamily serine protease
MSGFAQVSPLLRAAVFVPAAMWLFGVPVMAQREAESVSASFRKAVDQVSASVVSVRPVGVPGPILPPPILGGRFGPRPLGGAIALRPVVPMRPGGGSGVVVDASRGLILTSERVMDGAHRAIVTLADHREVEIERIARDPRSELVLLWVDAKNLPLRQAAWGDSDSLQAGDWVLAVGRTAGRGVTVSAGIASEARSGVESGRDDPIRTDAVITAVNAGGPLVDLDGKVVGINVGRGEPGLPHEGFSHAVPGSLARRVATELAEVGRVRRGFLGLVIGGDEPASLNPRETPGLLITGITAGGPADLAGLRVGDRIVALDGRPIGAIEELSRAVESAPVGQRFSMTVQRAGSRKEIEVQTAERPEPTGAADGPLRPIMPGFRGRPRQFDPQRGQSSTPGSRRRDGVLRSEPADDSPASSRPRQTVPAPKPGTAGSAPKEKNGLPEPIPEAVPEPKSSLPPALEPGPSRSS